MTHKRKILENPFRYISRGHGFTFLPQIWCNKLVGPIKLQLITFMLEVVHWYCFKV